MDYSTSLLIHQDKPGYGLFLRLLFIIPVGMAAGSLYYYLTGKAYNSLFLLIEAIIIGLAFWLVFPREYQIYDDHLRIVLGGPFSVKIGYQNIKSVSIGRASSMTLNFVTRITRKYVEIVKNRGMSIAITPADPDVFIEITNRALGQWTKTKSMTGVNQL